MNPRSRKYYENRTNDNGEKKGSSSKAGYNEEPAKVVQEKENPAPEKQQDKPGSDTSRANQDDTGGGHENGKRMDDN